MNEQKKENYNDLKKYYEIKKEIGKNWKSSTSKLFLIDKKWYYAWKEYVNKEYFDEIHQLNPEKKKIDENENVKELKWSEKPSPGPISNYNIILNLNSFYNDGDKDNPENYIKKPELSFKTDIKIIHEKLWNFYLQKFGGGPRLCYIINEKNNGENEKNQKKEKNKDYLFQINKYEIKLIFLPSKIEIIGDDEKIKKLFSLENIKSIYIQKEKLISDLINKIVETENKNLMNNSHKNHYNEKINANELKIWFNSLNEFNIENIHLLLIEYYGKETLNDTLKQNNNNLEVAKNILINKIIDQLLFSPKNLKNYCDENKTKIEQIFQDSNKSMTILIIDRNDLNYFHEEEIKENSCCSFCQQKTRLFYSCSCKKQWYCSKKCQYRGFNNHYQSCKNHCLEMVPAKKSIFSANAICGLKNLGNTCYMNTALQCLNCCWELTNFFLKNKFEEKINKENPLGYKGIICQAYSNLIRHLWNGVGRVYNPIIFFLLIGNINATFSGKNQQDAQEFLNFLIDGLHEDLNLVKNKPIIQEEKIKNENVKSKIEWLNFKRRNQSVLIKLFYGQFLSNISCPNKQCQHETTKFEPFMSVSVPLTLESKRIEINCYFIFYYTNIKPIYFKLSFNKDYTIMALRNKIAKILDIHPFSFVILKLDGTGKINYFANCLQLLSKTTIKSEHKNENPYFLMQIDPEIFYNSKNQYKNIKKKPDFAKLNENIQKRASSLEELFNTDYIEDEKGIPNIEIIPTSYYQINNDEESISSKNNKPEKNEPKFGNVIVDFYGLNDNYILVPLYINHYCQKDFRSPKFVTISRILFLKKDITCKDLHKLIFKIFNHVINTMFKKKLDFKDLFNDLSADMKEDYNKNDTYETQYQKEYPYRLRIVNINKKKRNPKKGGTDNIDINANQNNNIFEKCLICGEVNCRNCLLPYSSNIKLSDYLNKNYPKNSRGKTVDGTYYFLNENQRKIINYNNQDFQLEMTWLSQYKEVVFNIMNDFEKLNFEYKEKIKNESIPLTKCFDYFMTWEKLENYSFKCEVCKNDEKPLKKIQIYKCPYYLIIHLKRFIDDKEKINTEVKFPLRGLDLKKYIMDKNDTIEKIYDLRCIMYHNGNLGYGHYYSICYNTIHDKWFLYNDERVSEIKESDISSKDAYVLFYRRRGLEYMIDMEKIYLKEFKDYSNAVQNFKRMNSKNIA